MVSGTRVSWTHIIFQAIVAGIAGGALFGLYSWATTILPEHGSVAGSWQWIASTLFGKSALADSRFAPAGLAIAAIVSIGWAGGYAYLAATGPLANRRWVVSGLVYGLIVYAIMQTILLADDNFTYPPTPNAFLNALAAHAVFFGLPVAYVVRAMQRRAS